MVPSTGASINHSPRSRASSLQRAVPRSPIVLICSHTASPAGSPDKASSIDCSTASVSASIVRIMFAPVAASAAESSTSTPSSASGSAFSRERFQARTVKPARARLRAIGNPIVPPAPSTAIVG